MKIIRSILWIGIFFALSIDGYMAQQALESLDQGSFVGELTNSKPGFVSLPGSMVDDRTEAPAMANQVGVIGMGSLQFSPREARVLADPPEGRAPLVTTLTVMNLEEASVWMWELDWNADGKQDMSGQGLPACQVTYEIPGTYTPTFVFYNDFSEVIARASCTVTVAAETEGETGTQHQALKYTPRGGGGSDFGAGGLSSPLPAIDPQKLDDGPSNWVAPREEITDDLDPELYLFPERGSAPLTVRFDARDTFARYGVRAYNYDVVWGPNEEPDDGYYEQSGPDPRWTRTFEEYGLYKVILDVEDGLGKTSRTTRVIAVTSPGKSPHAKIAANVTKGYAPLVVLFQANQASLALENQAIYAFWDFDTNSLERPFGGDLGAYGTVVHTYQVPGKYTAGVILTDIDDNAGPMATVAIEVLAKEEDNGPKG